MVSISLPRLSGRGKPAAWLPGARGPPPSPGCGLRVLVFVGLVPRAPANGLPDSYRDIMHYVAKTTRKRLAFGLCTIARRRMVRTRSQQP